MPAAVLNNALPKAEKYAPPVARRHISSHRFSCALYSCYTRVLLIVIGFLPSRFNGYKPSDEKFDTVSHDDRKERNDALFAEGIDL